MSLNVMPKAGSANSNTPSRVINRQEVSVARPTQSTSRAEALKARLMNKAPAQPVAPRPTRTSARQEEISKLNKFPTTPPQPTKPAIAPKTSARAAIEDFNAIEPPPSGLAPGQVAQPTPTVETAPPSTEATSEPLSAQYVALARKEKQLRKAQQEFKASQDAWQKQQADYIPKSRLTSETLKVLAEAGITADKLVELQINQAASQDPTQVLLDRISQLENQIKGITDPDTGTLAQRDKAAYESAVKQIDTDAKLLVDSNPSYGTVKSEGKASEVTDLIVKVFEEEGVVLDVEEAAQLIEDKLVENLTKQYDKISKYEKIKAKLAIPAENPEEVNPTQQPPMSAPVKTLTNTGASTKPLSPRDRAVLRVKEAMAAAKGR